MKWSGLASGYGHLVYRVFAWQPVPRTGRCGSTCEGSARDERAPRALIGNDPLSQRDALERRATGAASWLAARAGRSRLPLRNGRRARAGSGDDRRSRRRASAARLLRRALAPFGRRVAPAVGDGRSLRSPARRWRPSAPRPRRSRPAPGSSSGARSRPLARRPRAGGRKSGRGQRGPAGAARRPDAPPRRALERRPAAQRDRSRDARPARRHRPRPPRRADGPRLGARLRPRTLQRAACARRGCGRSGCGRPARPRGAGTPASRHHAGARAGRAAGGARASGGAGGAHAASPFVVRECERRLPGAAGRSADAAAGPVRRGARERQVLPRRRNALRALPAAGAVLASLGRALQARWSSAT